MKEVCFCYRNIVFLLVIICQNGMSQVNANTVKNEIKRVKDKLACIYFDTLAFEILDTNICHSIDTALFDYIPIINTDLQINNYLKNKEKPILSEVLLIQKKDKKIVGSVQFEKNNQLHVVIPNIRNYSGKVSIRKENRLNYILPRNYKKMGKLINENKDAVFWIYVQELNNIYPQYIIPLCP